MNSLLWMAQIALAALFTASGAVKAVGSKDWLLRSGQTGVKHFGLPFIRFIAIAELFGAGGLILPWLTGIAPFLTPLAASGLGIIMVGAATAHVRLAREDGSKRERELLNVAVTLAVLMVCVFVGVGRAKV